MMLAQPTVFGTPSDGGGAFDFSFLGFEHFDWQMLSVMAGRLAVAAVLGAIVAYRPWRRFMPWHFEKTESGAQVLISVAGGLMVAVIGNNIALAFALVGLGGFIRFRSGIKDPREAGVMFLMIGIGMAAGSGMMPVALTATAFGIVLLVVLDYVERTRRHAARWRLKFAGVEDPAKVEPKIRTALARVATIRGSKITKKKELVVVDIYGDSITSAGEAVELLEKNGIAVPGEVSCEEQ
jgi:hypothetical protein